MTADSVETRVRVLRLENGMAMTLPVNELRREVGTAPDFNATLCECAERTNVISSAGVRSAMERRWRGAKGEVRGVAWLYERN